MAIRSTKRHRKEEIASRFHNCPVIGLISVGWLRKLAMMITCPALTFPAVTRPALHSGKCGCRNIGMGDITEWTAQSDSQEFI
ncbi:hypothetical protein BaRGS_00033640 [Batillaria attramentaria]|uniref:Uncharacterized protein n=1 Tax=Batillaria attramentaria TaxID=370345 RepID=A0ABD0JJC6_9CAEN